MPIWQWLGDGSRSGILEAGYTGRLFTTDP